MYEQLLKFESHELAKKSSVNWERVLEIRHLKDRMVRKCQRLSRAYPVKRLNSGESFKFQTLVAPSDFRLKEMEKWFHDQQRRFQGRPVGRQTPSHTVKHSPSSCCLRCSPTGHANPARSTASPHPRPSSSRLAAHAPPAPKPQSRPPQLRPPQSRPQSRSQGYPAVNRTTQRAPVSEKKPLTRNSSMSSTPTLTHNNQPSSPRAPPAPMFALRLVEEPLEMEDIPASETLVSPQVAKSLPPTPPAEEDMPSIENVLRRRRSCIKRSSTNDAAKTVSWADDRGWLNHISSYANTAQEAYDSGKLL